MHSYGKILIIENKREKMQSAYEEQNQQLTKYLCFIVWSQEKE